MIAIHPTTPRIDEFDQQLQIQKTEYESIIQRHLKFIDEVY